MNDFMKAAISEAYDGINNSHGGPFGSVVVKEGKIIGRGHNSVLLLKDPTCHGEIMAIKDACKKLDTYDLKGCELYTTAEPCPMCAAALMWANIRRVYYGCNRLDSDEIGFRDSSFYKMLNGGLRDFAFEYSRAECRQLFDDYMKIKDREIY